jgi:hypothetical protein
MPSKEAEAAWLEVERKVTAAGMSIGHDSKGRPNRVTFGTVTSNLSTSLVDILRPRVTHLPAWYRISSGASHNSLWLVQQGAAVTAEGAASLRADPDIITAATLAVLGAFKNVTQTFGTYLGHQGTTAAVRTVQRRTVAVIDRSKTWRKRMEEDARQAF